MGAYFGVGVYFGKYGSYSRMVLEHQTVEKKGLWKMVQVSILHTLPRKVLQRDVFISWMFFRRWISNFTRKFALLLAADINGHHNQSVNRSIQLNIVIRKINADHFSIWFQTKFWISEKKVQFERVNFSIVLSRGIQWLFGPTRKSSPWGNFSDRELNQSIKRRLLL